MSTDISYDLYVARCKLVAVAEMFSVDDDNGGDFRISPDEAQGVHAILSDICEDLRGMEKREETLSTHPATT